MTKVIAGMTVSLDGYVADRDGDAGALYPDLADLRGSAYMDDMIEETGAVLMGRRTFEMADPDHYVGNYEFQVPIFVLMSEPPRTAPAQDERLTFTFVTDGAESAVAQAAAAAGEKAVTVVGGPGLIGELLGAALIDELRVDVMPALLGGGVRFLEGVDPEGIRLQKMGIDDVGERTSLRFRVLA